MKKIISALLISSLLLINTVKVSAFVGSSSGQWGEDEGVNYVYNSDGTLLIKGTNGTEVVDSVCDSSMMKELKNIVVDNVGNVGVGSTYVFEHTSSLDLGYCYVNAETVESFIKAKMSTTSYFIEADTIIFGDNVKSIAEYAFNGDLYARNKPMKIVIPATVTSIADTCMNFDVGEFTIVCEYGSEAYNWASNKQNYHWGSSVKINIELSDFTAYSSVVLDATQGYDLVVPETIYFEWGRSGWESNPFVGVIGTIPSAYTLEIKTDESFTVIGDTSAIMEKVNVSTEADNTVVRDQMIVTSIDSDTLSNATDSFEIGSETKQGYKITYKCVTDNSKLVKQVYRGYMKFSAALQ